MNDPEPYASGSQGNPGESDPPLSPNTPGVQREDPEHAGQRARENRRTPEPVGGGRCCDRFLHEMKGNFENTVARHPCGAVALAFAAGVLCGVLAGRTDHCRW